MPPLESLDQIVQSRFVEGLWNYNNYSEYHKQNYYNGARRTNAMSELRDAGMQFPPSKSYRKLQYLKQWETVFDHLPTNNEDWTGYVDAINLGLLNTDPYNWVNDGNTLMSAAEFIRDRTERLADRRIAKVALAALGQRLQTGNLPTTIPLLGKDSIDPFTGSLFIYKVDGENFTIYSIGKDKIDDHGRSAFEAFGRGYDVVQAYGPAHIPKVYTQAVTFSNPR